MFQMWPQGGWGGKDFIAAQGSTGSKLILNMFSVNLNVSIFQKLHILRVNGPAWPCHLNLTSLLAGAGFKSPDQTN